MTRWELIKIWVISLSLSLMLRAIFLTLRFKRVGFEGVEADWPGGEPRIIAFWHGRQLFMPWVYLGVGRRSLRKPMYALISKHKDGRIAATVMKLLGVRSVAGSSSSGAAGAARELLRMLKRGYHIGITPDGPKGPLHKVKVGVVKIAQSSGAPIYPVAVGSVNPWVFKSWDRMILPKPFSRTVLIMGAPLHIPRDLTAAEVDLWQTKIEQALNEVTAQADGYRAGYPAMD